MLIALSVSAATDEKARLTLEQLPYMRGCEAHSTVMLSSVDEGVFRKLGIQLTCDPVLPTANRSDEVRKQEGNKQVKP